MTSQERSSGSSAACSSSKSSATLRSSSWTGTTTEIELGPRGSPAAVKAVAYAALVSRLLSIDEALERILAEVRPLSAEVVPVGDAHGRVLAEDAVAAVDLPPFASSAMDGFALRSADAPGSLPVVFRIAAGRPADRALEAGEAMGIATGGVVPEGADAVIPIEYVVDNGNSVDIPGPVTEGANVRPRGGDVHVGEVVARAGSTLSAAQIGGLAAAGLATVQASRRPRASVLTT